eukprot:3542460-Rhodomonas_salina.2
MSYGESRSGPYAMRYRVTGSEDMASNSSPNELDVTKVFRKDSSTEVVGIVYGDAMTTAGQSASGALNALHSCEYTKKLVLPA